jgi:hypothetical protein
MLIIFISYYIYFWSFSVHILNYPFIYKNPASVRERFCFWFKGFRFLLVGLAIWVVITPSIFDSLNGF